MRGGGGGSGSGSGKGLGILGTGEALPLTVISTTLSDRCCPSQSRSRAAELGRLILSKEGLVVVVLESSSEGLLL